MGDQKVEVERFVELRYGLLPNVLKFEFLANALWKAGPCIVYGELDWGRVPRCPGYQIDGNWLLIPMVPFLLLWDIGLTNGRGMYFPEIEYFEV